MLWGSRRRSSPYILTSGRSTHISTAIVPVLSGSGCRQRMISFAMNSPISLRHFGRLKNGVSVVLDTESYTLTT